MSIEIRPSSSLVDDYCWVRAALERSQLECIALKTKIGKLNTKHSVLKRKYQIALLALVKLSKYESARKAMEQCSEWDEKLKAEKNNP